MEDVVRISRESADYPPNVERYLGDSAPGQIWALGDRAIFQRRMTALFCSQSCPGDLASEAYDVAQQLRDAAVTVVSGFHSPMERECMKVLLSSPHPVVMGFGRALVGARVSQDFRRPLQETRLLILSGFGPGINRVTVDTARTRNRLLAALADHVFVAHARPESRTEGFCQTVLSWGKPLYTLDSSRNGRLVEMGAIPITSSGIRDVLS